MKIKKLALILSIILITCITSACGECDHQWSEATCLYSKTCGLCGISDGSALGHDFPEFTCAEVEYTCSRCGEIEFNVIEHIMTDATYDKPKTCTVCGYEEGNPLVKPSQWGFEHIDEMGNGLIRIEGYNISDKENAYVFTTANNYSNTYDAYKFENGYIFDWKYTLIDGQATFNTPTSPYQYTVVNNNNISVDSYNGTFSILERMGSKNRFNFIAFDCEEEGIGTIRSFNRWYVPYSIIDWERGSEKGVDEYGDEIVKLYVIQD